MGGFTRFVEWTPVPEQSAEWTPGEDEPTLEGERAHVREAAWAARVIP